jgi:hypothetical protein
MPVCLLYYTQTLAYIPRLVRSLLTRMPRTANTCTYLFAAETVLCVLRAKSVPRPLSCPSLLATHAPSRTEDSSPVPDHHCQSNPADLTSYRQAPEANHCFSAFLARYIVHGRAYNPCLRFSTTVVYHQLSNACFRIQTDTKAVGREPALQTFIGRLDVSSVSVRNLPATNGPASEQPPARIFFFRATFRGTPH